MSRWLLDPGLRRGTAGNRLELALTRLPLPALHDRLGDDPFLLDSQVPGLDLGLEALAVALAVEVLRALDLLVADAHRLHRDPRHAHGRFKRLGTCAAELPPFERV